ncbi:hypothetical protein F5Y18DRAFT_321900 [Xylariaceae sp. FL1019]|nr:hypothetical protein F5Y18DRAFT_321900 [Xylariaceae sp. FL1019]
MFPSNLTTKRLWYQSLIWSGLLFGSRCDDTPPAGGTESDLLVIGSPTLTTTSTITSTITITTTIAYSPTLAPGNSNYTVIGCYAQPTSNGGHIFGTGEYDACSDKVPPENLTIDGCLDGCASLTPKDSKNGLYTYVGLKNGSECICGLQLPQNTPNLTSEDCQTPCPGNGKLACGGEDSFVVYSLVAGDGNSEWKSTSSISSSKAKSQQTSTDSAHPVSSAADDKGEGSADEAHHSTLPASAAPGAAKKPISTPAVAAITGSFSGAILIGAGCFLCIRWRRKKKRVQEEHVKNMLERRGVSAPNPIQMTSAENHANVNVSVANVCPQRRDKPGSQDKDIRLTVDGDLIPTTPALESGGRYPSGLHNRRASAAGLPSNTGGQRPQSRESGKDTLYGNLLGEVRAGPAGSSSGVQWRQANNGYNNSKPNMPSAHRRTTSTQIAGIASPPPSAKLDSLGERAWHRRKISTPFPPPGVLIPVGLEAQQNAARRGPPSGPPTTPLPPTPMRKPRASGGRSQRPTENSAFRPPVRPRRSFDTITFPENYPTEEGVIGLGIVLPSTPGSKLGMSHANTSTPSLGRYGSISKPRPPTREYFEESPVLGRYLDNSGYDQWGNSKPKKLDLSREPTLPVLPPVKPGEKFDPKSWRGTIYAESTSSGRRTVDGDGDDDREPKSASSVGTSILYSPSEFDRRR